MTKFYAVCNVGGPISKAIDADSVAAAVEIFEAAKSREWIDEQYTDAEDDLGIDGQSMSESEFSEALEAAGCRMVRDLDCVHNTYSGQSYHVSDGWELWVGDNGKSYDSPEDAYQDAI